MFRELAHARAEVLGEELMLWAEFLPELLAKRFLSSDPFSTDHVSSGPCKSVGILTAASQEMRAVMCKRAQHRTNMHPEQSNNIYIIYIDISEIAVVIYIYIMVVSARKIK